MPDQKVNSVNLGGSALHISLSLESKKCVNILLDEMRKLDQDISGDDKNHSALDICLRNQWHHIGEELLKLGGSGKEFDFTPFFYMIK